MSAGFPPVLFNEFTKGEGDTISAVENCESKCAQKNRGFLALPFKLSQLKFESYSENIEISISLPNGAIASRPVVDTQN